MNYKTEQQIVKVIEEIKNKKIKIENTKYNKRLETEILTENSQVHIKANQNGWKIYIEDNFANIISYEKKAKNEYDIWLKTRPVSKSEKFLKQKLKDVVHILMDKNILTNRLRSLQTKEEDLLEKRIKEKIIKMVKTIENGKKEKREKEGIEIILFKKNEKEFELKLRKEKKVFLSIEKNASKVIVKTEEEEYKLISENEISTYDPNILSFYGEMIKSFDLKKQIEEWNEMILNNEENFKIEEEKIEELEYQEYFNKTEDYQEKVREQQKQNIIEEDVLIGVPITKEEVLGDDILVLLEKMQLHTFQNKELNKKIKELNEIYLEALKKQGKLMLLSKHYLNKNVPEDFKAFFKIMFDLPSKTYFEEKAFIFIENLTKKINEINRMIQKQAEDQIEIMLKVSEKREAIEDRKEDKEEVEKEEIEA